MRPIICFTLDSRSGEPMRPRKYFCATMFVAVCDQNFGNSTPFCSNTGLSLPGISASRDLPLDLVERVAPGDREVALEREFCAASTTSFTTSSRVFYGLGLLRGRHSHLLVEE